MKRYIDDNRREFLKKLIASTSMMGLAPLMISMESCTSNVQKPILTEWPEEWSGNNI